MEQIGVSPFLPMHESILDILVQPGRSIVCSDPEDAVAPYLGAMVAAGWVAPFDTFSERYEITDQGRHQLALIRAIGPDLC